MDAFTNQLLPDERIIWSGKPGQGLIFTPRDFLLIPFSLIWGGFAVFWEVMAVRKDHAPFFLICWGLPFLLAGIYIIAGRFVFDAYLRRRIDYAVTTQRVLISGPTPFASLTALSLNQLGGVRLRQGRDGRGTISFGGSGAVAGRNGLTFWTPSLDRTPQFIGVEDAQSVLTMIGTLPGVAC